ncbi:MAG: glycosyltransferase [Candidatus Brocadiaceae bacterium]|nr:glycosyltransferase [Candidatus Brocadiaceae bacterium]
MDISVCILTYNEEKNIGDCLKSILGQEYPGGAWEVLVIDGISTDKTIEIVKEFQKTTERIKLLINEKRKIAPGRNIAIGESRYPFIAFTDADCIVPKDWLCKLSGAYKDLLYNNIIAGVGGGNVPPPESSKFTMAIGLYLNSFLGSFNSPQGRNFPYVKKVISLPCLNVLYNKSILKEIGGFDEMMGNISEDQDINFRLNKRGYNLYFIPSVAVYHKMRSDLLGWLKNMALYGKGRAIISFRHSLFANMFFVLPLLFAVSMSLVPLGFINLLFLSPLLYFPFIVLYTLIISIKHKKINLFLYILGIFVMTHFVYAFNLLSKSLEIIYNEVRKKLSLTKDIPK